LDLTDIINVINKKTEEVQNIDINNISSSLSEFFRLYKKLAEIKSSRKSSLSDKESSYIEELLIPNMSDGLVKIKDALYNDRGNNFRGLDGYLERLVHYGISRDVINMLSIRSLSNHIVNEENIGLDEYEGFEEFGQEESLTSRLNNILKVSIYLFIVYIDKE